MSSTKHTTKADKTRNECTLLAEVAGLKENNRELAKSLAEKRKENIELRELQNKYVILENKFKINQKMHLSSISRLETYLMQTSSQLCEVVESISCIHKTLHESKRRSLMLGDNDKKKENNTIGNEKIFPSEDTLILEHINDVLNNITSEKQFNTLDKKEITKLSPKKTSEENSEKAIECSTRELESLPEVENNLISDFTRDYYLCESQTLTQSKSDTYSSCLQKKHFLEVTPEEFIDDGVSSKPKNKSSIIDEETQLDKTETTVIYVNGAQRITDVSTMVNSIGAETYHYSQDEDFQNFLADEETIIRRGIDQSLTLSHSHEIPLISVDTNQVHHIFHAKENRLRTNSSTNVSHQRDEQQSESLIISVNVSTHSTNLADTSNANEVKEQVTLDAMEQRDVKRQPTNYPIIRQNPIARNTKMRTSCKYFTEMADTEERRYTKLLNASPRREEKCNYSQYFTNSNFFQSLEQNKCIDNKTARISGEGNDYTIYSDSSSPNADTEKYLRRYKTLVNLNEIDNLKEVSRNGSCSGKENTHSLTQNKECRQTNQEKEFSRKPLQDRRNGIISGVEQILNSFKKSDVQDSLREGNVEGSTKICSKVLLSENRKEDSAKTNYPKKKIIKKSRKKPRLRKQEKLRL